MSKKILYFIVVLVFLFVCGCTDDFSGNEYKESLEIYKISKDINAEFKEFMKELNKYADSFEKNMKLGSIQLNYNNQNNLLIYFDYYKIIDKNSKSVNLHFEYELEKQAIVFTDFTKGSSKIIPNCENSLDITKWQISIDQGFKQLKNQMDIEGLSNYKKIICYCRQNDWIYYVFDLNNNEHEISINPC